MLVGVKFLLALAGIATWFWTQHLLHRRPNADSRQIGDLVHDWTTNLNSYLSISPRAVRAMLISSSLIVDILGLYLLASGVFGNSVRPLLGLIILFSLRQLSQFITSLPTPPGMIWRDPGFPSLLVTYEVSNDLFFSGHTALAFFGATELMHTGNSYLAGLGILASLYQVAVMLALRAHWTMDIFAGGVTALWIAELVAQISPSIDLWLLGIL